MICENIHELWWANILYTFGKKQHKLAMGECELAKISKYDSKYDFHQQIWIKRNQSKLCWDITICIISITMIAFDDAICYVDYESAVKYKVPLILETLNMAASSNLGWLLKREGKPKLVWHTIWLFTLRSCPDMNTIKMWLRYHSYFARRWH